MTTTVLMPVRDERAIRGEMSDYRELIASGMHVDGAKAAIRQLQAELRAMKAKIRSLVEDEGMTRAEAKAWVANFGVES